MSVEPWDRVELPFDSEGEWIVRGPTPETIGHYVRMFDQLRVLSPYLGESLCWTVVRPLRGQLTVGEVVLRLNGDPDTMTLVRPVDDDDFEGMVFLEQRDDAVIIVENNYGASADEGALRRLSQGATVHGVFWLVNNYNVLYYAVDGVLTTGLRPLSPHERWGADPEALTDHLVALIDLEARRMSATDRGPFPDWETAMATVESLSSVRLNADWFDSPQLLARVNCR